MRRTFARMIWIAAIAAAMVAIVSVAIRPEPATPIQPEKPKARPPKDPAQAEAFIEQAHREALDRGVTQLEQELPKVALWSLLRLDTPVSPPFRPLGQLVYNDTRRWETLTRELSSVDPARLDTPRKALRKSALFMLHRALESRVGQDPFSIVGLVESLLDDLQGRWLRGEDSKNWQDPLQALGQTLSGQSIAQPLRAKQLRAFFARTRAQSQRLTRWRKDLDSLGLDASWDTSLGALQSGLEEYVKKIPQGKPATVSSDLTQDALEVWSRRELGLRATPSQALQAIAQTGARLDRIRAQLPKTAPTRPRVPTVEDCQRQREALHALVPTPGPWIEAKLDCSRLIALTEPQTTDALMHALIVHGWIEPTRQPVRRAQRPVIAALASRWGATVNAQLRELMFLAALPTSDWNHHRQSQLLSAMQESLCQARLALAPLDPSSLRPRCQAPADPDSQRALGGIRLGAMPHTRARMAGLDRFYWAPLQVALYLADPSGGPTDSQHAQTKPRPAKIHDLQDASAQ